MKKINELLDFLKNRLFSSTYQLQRVVTLTGVALVLAVISFGSYYYYDRYYTNQPTLKETSLEDSEKAVRDDPQNVDARLQLADTYMTYGRFDEAISQAECCDRARALAHRIRCVIRTRPGRGADEPHERHQL